jgi:hypothetical protein
METTWEVFGWRMVTQWVTDHTVMPIKVREDPLCLAVSSNRIRRTEKALPEELVNLPWWPVFRD